MRDGYNSWTAVTGSVLTALKSLSPKSPCWVPVTCPTTPWTPKCDTDISSCIYLLLFHCSLSLYTVMSSTQRSQLDTHSFPQQFPSFTLYNQSLHPDTPQSHPLLCCYNPDPNSVVSSLDNRNRLLNCLWFSFSPSTVSDLVDTHTHARTHCMSTLTHTCIHIYSCMKRYYKKKNLYQYIISSSPSVRSTRSEMLSILLCTEPPVPATVPDIQCPIIICWLYQFTAELGIVARAMRTLVILDTGCICCLQGWRWPERHHQILLSTSFWE